MKHHHEHLAVYKDLIQPCIFRTSPTTSPVNFFFMFLRCCSLHTASGSKSDSNPHSNTHTLQDHYAMIPMACKYRTATIA
eukprot:c29187_g1_i1 orf=1-237(-)